MSNSPLEGTIINIQKFSINDGPGIRTTIFFKGCPLACKWCANPESQRLAPELMWDEELCHHCLTCVKNCPQQALSFKGNKLIHQVNKCNHCGKCHANCPQYALKLMGEKFTVSQLLKICKQDLPFYEESNGGITLSGGEVMSQSPFVIELIQALKANKLHVALETTAYTSPAIFQKVIQQVDLLIIDIKHWDREKHQAYTGVDPEIIWNNIKLALAANKEILLRIPVIPDFNYSVEDGANFAKLIMDLGLDKVQLLPFHQYGSKKYQLLSRNYHYATVPALNPQALTPMLTELQNHKINAFT